MMPLKPEEIGKIRALPKLRKFNYTAQDFWSIKAQTIEYLKTNFNDRFTNFVESDLSIILLEQWAFMADLLSFKMDMTALENHLETMTQFKSVQRNTRPLGFAPRAPQAATAMISISVPQIYNVDIIIPAGFVVTAPNPITGDAVNFTLHPANERNEPLFDQDITIPANTLVNLDVIAVEGREITAQFQGAGQRFEKHALPNGPVVEGSVRVFIDGIEWTEVDTFAFDTPQRVFRTIFDEDFNAVVQFGDGINGIIPQKGSIGTISFRVGGGEAGNIVIGAIDEVRNFTTIDSNENAPVTITNVTAGKGGREHESIDEVRARLPRWLRTQFRAVTAEDYTIQASQFQTRFNGSIGKAIATRRFSGCAANVIDVWVLENDGSDSLILPNEFLKEELGNFLDSIKMMTHDVTIQDGKILEQDISITLVVSTFFTRRIKEIEQKVRQALDDLFAVERWDFGRDLKRSEITKILSDISEIIEPNITFGMNSEEKPVDNGEAGLVSAEFNQIIVPRDIEINFDFVDA